MVMNFPLDVCVFFFRLSAARKPLRIVRNMYNPAPPLVVLVCQHVTHSFLASSRYHVGIYLITLCSSIYYAAIGA